MKLIIAGGRDINLQPFNVYDYLEEKDISPEDIELVISGGATGVDTGADYFSRHYDIPFKEFPANWLKHGKAAGPIRNREMAKYGDALLLIWDGQSRGSANMKKEMEKLGKPIYEIIIRK